MTITKDFAAKLTVALVAVAMIFAVLAPKAQAQSAEEMQQMINDLLSQVASLQSQLGQGDGETSTSGVCPYTWTRDLSSGSTGDDVMNLQQFLNSDPDTRVAASGAGSVGNETDYYGPATAAAVSKFQVKYRSDVLSPLDLVNPTGYFGSGSRDKANSLCMTPAPTPGDEDEDESEDEDEEEEEDEFELGGEAALDTFEIDDASDDDIEEGAEDAEIGEITIEFDNGDAEISRIDLQILGNGETDTDTVEPWEAFETISLWVDGDKIAEEDVDDEDNYLDEDDGTIRFSNLDLVGEEEEEVEIVVAATVQNSLDNNELTTWDLSANSMRFFDADGVAITEDGAPVTDDTASFTIDEEGAEDELDVRTSSNDPESTTLQVEDDSDSDWYTVFAFDLDTGDSTNDIEIDGIDLKVTISSSSYNAIVDDAELVIDGTTIDDFEVINGTSSPAILEFDVDGDVVIEAGDEVEVELMLQFNSLDDGNEGITVMAEVDSADIVAEGADDITDLSGAATGDQHTLRTTGIDTETSDSSAEVTSVDGDDNDYATFEIEVDVTAFEQDVYIPTDGSSITAIVSTSTGTTSVSVTLDSSADEVGDRYEITEGSSDTVTLRYTLVQTATGSDTTVGARLILQSIGFYDVSSGGTLDTQSTLPASDYRTSQVDIIN